MTTKWIGRVMRWAAAGLLCTVLATRAHADLAADLARVAVEAAGGRAAHEALQAWKADGITRVGEQSVVFLLYAARPDRVRIETLGEQGSLVRSYDGERAPWRKDGPLAPPRRLGRAEELEFVREADFDSPLYEAGARGVSLDYAGEQTVDGRLCQKLLATLRGGALVTLYLDDETRLLVRRDTVRRSGGREVVEETHYADHRPVAGVMLPHLITAKRDGVVLHETRIREYTPNPVLMEGFFAPPVADWPRL
ncbi:MAG: hypothetical protein MUE42_11655 [Opitutaceae bacterium]|nr:hypothetical protein [Opitutaceae bacterium]